ncbi:hypothetical protein EMIHUDRAFT_431914, partial [Emiliania huxleyi CCMP1516]|uniref:Uncharacterized protein n=2 Tax=Emiliania huxleyi TaxID=2903 RepID=A0A0D3L209_EMIH1
MRAHLDTIRSGGRDTGTAERRLAQLQQERVAIFTHASNVLTTVFVLLIGAAVVIALHRSPQPVMPPPAAPPQPPTARSLPDACIAEDELRAAVARAGREAAWHAAQRPISACLAAAVSARATCHDARAVRAVALCTYGPDASVLFPDQHCMMTLCAPRACVMGEARLRLCRSCVCPAVWTRELVQHALYV